ncbi:hypothetical protein JCM10207_008330 [Rhodosporidiobolus poonsookiae]
MRRYLPASLFALAVLLLPLFSPASSLALAAPVHPRAPLVGAGIAFTPIGSGQSMQQPAVRRSDLEWICDPLQFSVSFLRAPASLSVVTAPAENGTYETLETLAADLDFPTTVKWTVDLPVGTKFALRVEDAAGAVELSEVREVEKAGYPYLSGIPVCKKRNPSWIDRNRSWLDITSFVVLASSVMLLFVYFYSWMLGEDLLEIFRGSRVRRYRQGGAAGGHEEELRPDMDDGEGDDDGCSSDGTGSTLSVEMREVV